MNYNISIIIPVFNVEKHINKALKSIIKQTIGFENIEVIMVDDCSTDKSGEIIDGYASEYDNFIAIHLPENSGAAGKPRNTGIRKATGNYIMFLDPDDYYTNDACEVLHNKIIEEDVDIVFGNYSNFCDDTPLKVKKPFGLKDEIKVHSIHEETRLLTITPSIWTKLFKTSFIKENDIVFPEGIPGQDLVFLVSSFLNAKGIIFLNNFIVCKRIMRYNGNNRSMTYIRNKKYCIGLIKAYSTVYDIFKGYHHEEYISPVLRPHIYFWMKQFVASDLNPSESEEVLVNTAPLFKKLNSKRLKFRPEHWDTLFNFIFNEKYDESIILTKVIRSFLEREKKLLEREKKLQDNNKSLKVKFNQKKQQVAVLQTVNGWIIYKSKNIWNRSKKKVNAIFKRSNN